MAEAENHALPGATNESWRTWLMTGFRRAPFDLRRVRGAHRGLKKMFIEGMTNGEEKPRAWKEFSGAMIRHAVDDAMRALPVQDKVMVKMAYFGGLSNREIAEQIGTTEATVQRRLRHAVAAISEYIERGRSFGRRAFYALAIWFCGRWVGDAAHQAAQSVVVMSAAVIIVAQPTVPLGLDEPSPEPVPVNAVLAPAAPAAHDPVAPSRPTPSLPDVKALPQKVPPPAVHAPKLDLPVTVPSIPPRLPSIRPPAG